MYHNLYLPTTKIWYLGTSQSFFDQASSKLRRKTALRLRNTGRLNASIYSTIKRLTRIRYASFDHLQ